MHHLEKYFRDWVRTKNKRIKGIMGANLWFSGRKSLGSETYKKKLKLKGQLK